MMGEGSGFNWGKFDGEKLEFRIGQVLDEELENGGRFERLWRFEILVRD